MVSEVQRSKSPWARHASQKTVRLRKFCGRQEPGLLNTPCMLHRVATGGLVSLCLWAYLPGVWGKWLGLFASSILVLLVFALRESNLLCATFCLALFESDTSLVMSVSWRFILVAIVRACDLCRYLSVAICYLNRHFIGLWHFWCSVATHVVKW